MDSVRVILQAVNERNLELAQRTVDAEVRKNPESDVYLALKVYVAAQRNDSQLALETAQRAVKVCSKKTMEMFLIPVLMEFDAGDLLSAAFVRVNRLVPTDHEVAEAWLECSLGMGDLSSAQKALMAMQRTTSSASSSSSSSPRAMCYSACFVMALDHAERPNKLFPALADRMIAKYLPASNPQECYVVALVRRMTSLDAMTAYLRDPEVFDAFVCGTLDLQLLLLHALLDLKRWDDVFEYSMAQLRRIDSYNYWQALNRAAHELGRTAETAQFITSASAATSSSAPSANALLSRVDLAALQNDSSALTEAIAGYWAGYKTKPSTFKYLRPFISDLIKKSGATNGTSDLAANAALVDFAKPSNGVGNGAELGAEINYAKLRNLVGDPLSTEQLVRIYETHLHEVPAEKTDYFQGTDALLIIAKSLILRSDNDDSRTLAAVVLEYALAADPHNFDVRLLLIQIYQSLGALALAQRHFNSLSIRNIQDETLGYLLSTRIGSVSPELARPVLARLKHTREKVPSFGAYSRGALNDGAYTQFDGIFQLGQRLRLSLDQCLLSFERLRAARNATPQGSTDYGEIHRIPRDPHTLVDNRDFAIANFDDGLDDSDANIVETLFIGPRQGGEYVDIQRQKEIAWHRRNQFAAAAQRQRAAASTSAAPPSPESAPTPTTLSSLYERAQKCAEFTEIERWNVHCVELMLGGDNSVELPEPPALDTSPSSALDWRVFHWCNTVRETSRLARMSKTRLAFEPAKLIRALVTDRQNRLHPWEAAVNAKFRESRLPGEASSVVRAIKKEHLAKLKHFLETN